MPSQTDVSSVAREFQIPGKYLSFEPLGSGHINDSWRVTYEQGGERARYLLQRINSHVFHNPRALMENVQRVTAHLARRLADEPDGHRRSLTLIPSREERAWHRDGDGDYWRVYRFIEGARSCPAPESAGQAYEAARAFGRFQRLLSDLPPPRLHDTIPDFHNTPSRFASLERAIAADGMNRARQAAREIEFALKRRSITTMLLEAGLPERVTHNDTKFSNVLLDETTDKAVCVVDLDTVMPGLAPYDFGDIVRSTTTPAAEDERDLSKITLRLPLYKALLRGYCEETTGFLTPAERKHLAVSGKLITFETGLRFLTDFLEGDTYFKTQREGHNLDRCRTQFKLVESIEQQEEAMMRLVETLDSV